MSVEEVVFSSSGDDGIGFAELELELGKADRFVVFSMASIVVSAARSFSLKVSFNASSRLIGSGMLDGWRKVSAARGEPLPMDGEDRKEIGWSEAADGTAAGAAGWPLDGA